MNIDSSHSLCWLTRLLQIPSSCFIIVALKAHTGSLHPTSILANAASINLCGCFMLLGIPDRLAARRPSAHYLHSYWCAKPVMGEAQQLLFVYSSGDSERMFGRSAEHIKATVAFLTASLFR